MAVRISGMFGSGHTYFAGSPVVIDISGLEWPTNEGVPTSPFNIVRLIVYYNNEKVGEFMDDTGGQSTASFDISSALRTIWADYDFAGTEIVGTATKKHEVPKAEDALDSVSGFCERAYRSYSLEVQTEYLDSQDGEFTQTSSGRIDGGRCAIGAFNEWERSTIQSKEEADMSYLEHINLRNGDASTKPTSSPERVGQSSITSYVDVSNSGTKSYFYASNSTPSQDVDSAHAPIVLRDSQDYADFLFVNRRGAVETCSCLVKESMDIGVETKSYARVERPSFKPSRSLMAIASGGRRSWGMSSGYVDREWAEWWTMEFLLSSRHWMRYDGRFVPVTVEPSKKSVDIYDRSKQQLPHVDFTVTLALEG